MSWDSFVLIEDTDLGRLEPEAIDPDKPWGQASWPRQIEQAKRQLRDWIDTDYTDVGIGASDRIRDTYNFGEAKTQISGAFTDVVTESQDSTEEDINLATALATATDYINLGARFTYEGVYIDLLDSVNANTSAMTVEYWGKNQWTSVPSQSDGTAATSTITLGQSGRVTWAPITDWERRSLDGSDESYYWVRMSVDNALTAGTSASHLLAVRKPEGLRTVGLYLALSFIMRGLAAQSTEEEEWNERATAYMDDAKGLYERLRTTNAIPIDSDLSGGISAIEADPRAALLVNRMPRA